ncbi:Asp-rich hydrophilic protein (putative membrane protein) [Streptomyces lincolnensis]|uniref:Asp-rich hydrophilic protein (Putative membrane protein) n=1 Tax=Streptomyces lincolnensis TaxID=1915 RepID=A0A1B1MHG5_STRLN|nr:PepSY domain-containing protein [Streptomyces lincolnensis]ANS68014.1 Asp-rich hydrophilic protein (putative membrane protein) [Streptomyces lincolnensis]AXG53780.1 Asp-rich hydrophilic protein (putative membrane protein) [Streptomyces lincolnensis]QMV09667.1 peptidase propeptide and YpeB domain protein [Streptomyces lincolnensis]
MKRNIVIAAVTAAALIGGGTATALAVSGDSEGTAPRAADMKVTGAQAQDDDRDDVDGKDDDRDDGRDDRDDSAASGSAKVTAADAIAAALKHTPGTAVSADYDDQDGDDRGPAAWEVDVLGSGSTWHSVRIDPANGKVLGSHTEREDDTAEVRAALKGSSVTAQEAAKAAAGKGTVTSVDLDDDGRDKGWDVETHAAGKAEQDWTVDLTTGKVTADTADDADDSNDD